MNRLSFSTAIVILVVFTSYGAFPQGNITGPDTPCIGSKAEYSYCRSDNFPYNWRWSVTGDAIVRDRGTSSTCYLAEVTLGQNSTLLTFHQSNPPGLPQVHNVTKQINPKKCEASKESRNQVLKLDINWAEYRPNGKHPAQVLLDRLYGKRNEIKDNKALGLKSIGQSDNCSYVYWGCGSCPGGGAQVDAYCGGGGSEPDYSWCESC